MIVDDVWRLVDWTAIASIAACIGVIASALSVRRQLRQQNDLALKGIEEGYLRQILERSDHLHLAIRRIVEWRTLPGHRVTDSHLAEQLEDAYRAYRRGVHLALRVVRATRRRRFPPGVTDTPLEELEGLVREVFDRHDAFVKRIVKNIADSDPPSLGTEGALSLIALDGTLTHPVSEMIARLYTDPFEWREF